MHQLPMLKGCDIHSTVILSSVDADTLKKLGMNLTCDPVYEKPAASTIRYNPDHNSKRPNGSPAVRPFSPLSKVYLKTKK